MSILVMTSTVIRVCLSMLRRSTLRVVTSAFIAHRTVLSGVFINVFKVRTIKPSENSFQHEIYGTVSKLFHNSHVTACWQ